MKHKRLLTVLIAGVAAAASPDYAQVQSQTDGAVNSPVEQGPPPVEETDLVAFFKMIASGLHLTHPTPVDDNGLPAFHPRTGALHHKRTGGEARPQSARYATEVVADRPEPVRVGPDIVTLSREEYDALRDLAAQAQAAQTAAAAGQSLYQAAYQDAAEQTAAANPPTTDSNVVGQSSLPVLKVALPVTPAVTRPPNQAPSATGVPPLRRKMKREE